VDMTSTGNGKFFMIYSEELDGVSSIYYSKSLDNGAAWFFPQRLTAVNENGRRPLLTNDNSGNIYMVWVVEAGQDETDLSSLWFASSTDQWATQWTSHLLAQGDSGLGTPALKTDGNGALHLLWYGNFQIIHSISSDMGKNWTDYPTALEGEFWNSWNSSLHIDNDRLYLLWNTQNYLGHNNVNWIHFADGPIDGSTWNAEQLLDNICSSTSQFSAIWARGNNVDVLMADSLTVFLLRSTDRGLTWSYPEHIAATRSDQPESKLMTMVENSAGQMFIVFVKKDDSTLTTGSLYFIRSN